MRLFTEFHVLVICRLLTRPFGLQFLVMFGECVKGGLSFACLRYDTFAVPAIVIDGMLTPRGSEVF